MEKTAVDFNKVVGKEALTSVLKFLVLTLTRRISDDGAPEAVSNHAQQVAERIKGNKSVYLEAGLRKTCEMLGFNPILFIAGMVVTEGTTARQWLPLATISLSDGEIVAQHVKLTALLDLNVRPGLESRNTWLNV